ncbi:hypothetical protein EGH22_18890 [Halomicroarcula sp. F28]|uniref:hypothetical protein n=1 Tax=Haloarcula salinisoli TaxID=2487746 RepID=UPI001C72A527|nr:hypothetical protein [Halomicroarcula salinisoli]MBX0288401.1 hypothetical protein [Halomicroarcula salinisoli]
MTSDDTDTGEGNDANAERTGSSEQESSGPLRDPETGEFLSKDERPDDESEPTTEMRETEPESMDDEHDQESESMEEAHGSDSEPRTGEVEDEEVEDEPQIESTDEAEPTDASESERETADSEATPGMQATGASAKTSAAGPEQDHELSTAGSAATAQQSSPGTVFVPNPDGYPRPPATYLPTLPWLRLPSRAPAYETVSV